MYNTGNKELEEMKALKDAYGSGSAADAYKANVDTIANAYANTVDKAQAALLKQKKDAETAYNKVISSYGANAEALRSKGFNVGTGGYSSFLDASAHQAKVATQNAAQSAYDTAIKDAEIAKQDKLNANKAEYDSVKNSAYASILEGVANGTYATDAQINAAKNAYKTLYGDLDGAQSENISNAYALVNADSGVYVSPDNFSTNPEVKAAQFNTLVNTHNESLSNMFAKLITDNDNSSLLSDVNGLLTDYDKLGNEDKQTFANNISEGFDRIMVSYLNHGFADENKNARYDDALKVAVELDKKMGTNLTDSVITKMSESGKLTGENFSALGYLSEENLGGGLKKYDKNSTGYDHFTLKIDGTKYTVKIDQDSVVDDATSAILDKLYLKYSGASENSEHMGVVMYNGVIYVHNGDAGWRKGTEQRSEAEKEYLKGKSFGYKSDNK